MAQKTPVSLMNELAKTNKLTPEYKLVEESGPAHQRTFRLQLTLGDVGTWEGIGSSIKQARHAAAQVGLEKCGLCIHEKKPKQQPVNLTPTVELNGLAMKLGKRTEYHDLPPVNYSPRPPFQFHVGYPGGQMSGMHRPQPSFPIHQPGNYHGGYQHRPNFYQRQGRWPRSTHVSLTVGDQVFKGEGTDKQIARHNAALKAIEALRKELALVCESATDSVELTNPQKDLSLVQNGDSSQVSPTSSPPAEGQSSAKSEISLVYEIATRRKMPVQFEDVNNTGPAHMKKFLVRATVGDFVKEGEGPKKKDAKNDAAKKILEELNTLPELLNTDSNKRSNKFSRRGPRIFSQKPKADIDPSLNPISILGQIYQKAKEPSPVYTTVQDRSIIQGKEFVIQVSAGKHQATGTGRNKKEAKKNAAEAMLQLIGFRPTPAKEDKLSKEEEPVSKGSSEAGNSRQVHTILGRQLKPGLLPMVPEMAKMMGCNPEAMINTVVAPIAQVKQEPQVESVDVEGSLNRAPGAPVVKMPSSTSSKSLTSFQKLFQLTDMQGLRVQFTDYPKENNQAQVSHVSVSCVPPLSVYGSGVSVEGSREEAAANALKELTEMLAKDQLKQGVNTSQPGVVPGVKDEMRERPTEVTNE